MSQNPNSLTQIGSNEPIIPALLIVGWRQVKQKYPNALFLVEHNGHFFSLGKDAEAIAKIARIIPDQYLSDSLARIQCSFSRTFTWRNYSRLAIKLR